MIQVTNETENELQQAASEIQQKIALLTDFSGDSLKLEMQSLKKALLQNPAACSLLLEEDIGLAVASLRRMVGIAVASASAKKTKAPSDKKPTVKKLTAAELAAALAEVSDDDL